MQNKWEKVALSRRLFTCRANVLCDSVPSMSRVSWSKCFYKRNVYTNEGQYRSFTDDYSTETSNAHCTPLEYSNTIFYASAMARLAGRRRCYVVKLSVRLSVHVRSSVTKLWTWYFENESTDFYANWHKLSAGQGRKMINFVVRRSMVKVTRGQRWIWSSGRGIIFDSLGLG